MGRSMVYDRQFYYNLGKSLGLTGADLDEDCRHGKGWQAQAIRDGYRSGSALYTLARKGKGHREKSTAHKPR